MEWWGGQFAPGLTDADAGILDVVRRAHGAVSERPQATWGTPYGSDLRLMTNLGGIPTVHYGPGDAGLAHGPYESVPVAELLTATRALALVAVEHCGRPRLRTGVDSRRQNREATREMTEQQTGTSRVKRGMAEMLKGGVIMDVVTADQAKIAEDAGAVAVMALERVPADIRAQGGVSRMSDPDMIDGIIAAVSIPVMAKARIGHFVEAQVLQSLGVDYVDESEVLTPADYAHHIDKWAFTVPFVCGATNLGEALRRISEGAAMIRSKGEAGTGDVSNATTHMRQIRDQIRRLTSLPADELYVAAKELQAPYDLVKEVAEAGKLPVVLFTAGGIATPADAAMMMQLGAEGVFVGSGIFKSGNPEQRAAAIVKATTFFDDPDVIAKVSRGLGEAMVGINVRGDPRAAPARRARLVTPG